MSAHRCQPRPHLTLHIPSPTLERFYQTLKTGIRRQTPLSLDVPHRIVGVFIVHYNTCRLHNAIGYVTPHAV
ncbi:MAG: integrase core domain-containing protein [Anaerolineae bacterium]